MKIIYPFSLLLFLSCSALSAQIKTSEQLIKTMHKKYFGKHCKSFTFVQDNKHYKGDTVQATSVWYETIQYPDNFRIDYGDPALQNAMIFRGDSAFQFEKGKLKHAGENKNTLLLILGGMYFLSPQETIDRLGANDFNLKKFSTNTFNGTQVYVIGAEKNDSLSSQFWVEAKTFHVLRIITPYGPSRTMDMHLSDYKKNCGGYTETLVKAFINGKLVQEERYREINPDTRIPVNFFEPSAFGSTHWKK
jgi:outer membrane lipoprotein-sorting protein